MVIHKMVTMTLVLTGHFSGKTVKLNGTQFRDGKVRLHGPVKDVENLAKYLRISYQAIPEEELDNGTDSTDTTTELGGSDPLQSEVYPDGSRPEETSPVLGLGDDDSNRDSSGSDPSGDRHEDSGVSSEDERFNGTAQGKIDPVKLRKVLEQLDPKDDSAWTTMGFAKLDRVCAIYGNEGVTRRDIEAVWPDFTRKGQSLAK